MTIFDGRPKESLRIWRFWSRIVIDFLSQFHDFLSPAGIRFLAPACVAPWFSRPRPPFFALESVLPEMSYLRLRRD